MSLERSRKRLKMADITGVLSSSRFRLTNIKVLSLLFTEHPFSHIFDRFHVLSVFIEGGNS